MKLSTCTEWLFFHLWKKNPQTGQSCYGVFLTDTVIYRWAQPYFRYFTATNGQIIRKTKERVFIDNVEESFIDQQQEAVAVLLTSQPLNKSERNNQQQIRSKVQEIINFEYFDKNEFKKLHQREKDLNAILQKFVAPKGGRNSMIKVSWSPQFCLLHRKTNIHSISDTKKSLIERVCTFEGPEYLAESDSISSPLLSADLEQLCVNIVKHIQEVSGGNIQIIRMVLYFKIDDDNRIWLLFCTGIKVRDKFGPANIQEEQSYMRLDSPVLKVIRRDEEHQRSLMDPISNTLKMNEGVIEKLNFQQKEVCSNCDKFARNLYDLQFSHIIRSFNQYLINDNEGHITNDFTRLPNELEKIKQKGLKTNIQVQRMNPSTENKVNQQDNMHFEIENEINRSSQKLLINKYHSKKNRDLNNKFDSVEEEIQELCRYLDDEQEDQKINFKSVPALIIKVWKKLPEEKYQILCQNPSWRALKTQVCLDCFLQFTQVLETTQLGRQVQLKKAQLKDTIQKEQKKQNIELQKTQLKIKSVSQLKLAELQQPKILNKLKLILPKQKVQIITMVAAPPLINPQLISKVKTRQLKNSLAKIYSNNYSGIRLPQTPSTQIHSTFHNSDYSSLNRQISYDYLLNTVSELKVRWSEVVDS